MRARGRRALVVVAGIVLLASCRLELDVDVTVARDGSGTIEVTVALDDDAVAAVGGDLEEILALDDLSAAGWTVDGPRRDEAGRTRLQLRRPFADPGDAAAGFAELSGRNGPFEDLAVTRERSFFEERWGFRGRIDLGRDLAVRGEPLGEELARLEGQLGQSLGRLVQVRVRVRLPGEVTSNATTRADNGAVWQVAFGGSALELEATGTERRTSSFLLVGAGALGAVVLLAVALIRLAVRAEDAVSREGRAAP